MGIVSTTNGPTRTQAVLQSPPPTGQDTSMSPFSPTMGTPFRNFLPKTFQNVNYNNNGEVNTPQVHEDNASQTNVTPIESTPTIVTVENNADNNELSQADVTNSNNAGDNSSPSPVNMSQTNVLNEHVAITDTVNTPFSFNVESSQVNVTNANNADSSIVQSIVHENNGDDLGTRSDSLTTPQVLPDNNSIVIQFCNKDYVLDVTNKESLCVINLSNRPLTPDETSILKKGLKFCPTPGEPNMYDIHRDLRQFFRRMRLRAHFTNMDEVTPSQQRSIRDFLPSQSQNNGPDLRKYKPKSTWEPGLEFRDPVLETFFKCVQSEVANFTPREPRVKNITKDEKEAIADLSKDPTIIVKKADKGAAIVIMNRDDYIKEAERQLSDTDFYIRQNSDLTKTHSVRICEFLTEMLENEEIDQKIFDSLNPTEPKTSRFYFLPKIHKPIVKGRPIISGNGCPTEMISAFVDDHLKEYVQKNALLCKRHFRLHKESGVIPTRLGLLPCHYGCIFSIHQHPKPRRDHCCTENIDTKQLQRTSLNREFNKTPRICSSHEQLRF